MNNIKLSVIMPLYNVEATLSIALDSVIMQKVNFDYEIICVDDKSTDNTLDILNSYKKKYPFIKIIQNQENCGNAHSFCRAIQKAKGEYFCVLDGDDYYTISNKFQKQIDFLDGDKGQEYVAVAHKYLRVMPDGRIVKDRFVYDEKNEYTYYDFINRKFYFHTSTYIYRNIFKEKLPSFFIENRGDMPRTFISQLYTLGKVKILNFVGSVYNYNNNGIWSSMTQEEQVIKNNVFWQRCSKLMPSELEKKLILKHVVDLSRKDSLPSKAVSTWSVAECFDSLINMSSKYAFSKRDFTFARLFKSEFIDSFCETLGRIELNTRKISPIRKHPENDNILINVACLNEHGGGIYNEIKELISIYSDKKVFLLLEDVKSPKELSPKIIKEMSEFKSYLTLVFNPEQGENKLKNLFDIILNIQPSKIYHCCGHNFCYVNALIQRGLAKNIVLFSIDHGFSLGIDNSSIDILITKIPSHYKMLKTYYSEKVIYIPVWSSKLPVNKKYIPFNNHKNLNTATAAARFYKFDGAELPYEEFVVQLLNCTKGVHYHYGPIPDDRLAKIKESLKKAKINENKFQNIIWADNIPQSLIDNNVDLFIAPFPIGSAKISMQVEMAGVPLICYHGDTRIECSDFIAPDALFWTSFEEFFTIVSNLNTDKLKQISKAEKDYFFKHNDLDLVKDYIKKEKNFEAPKFMYFYDNRIVDIQNVIQFFNATQDLTTAQQSSNAQRSLSIVKRGGLWKYLEDQEQKSVEHPKKYSIFYKILRHFYKNVLLRDIKNQLNAARVDIKNYGNVENSVIIKAKDIQISTPKWFVDGKGTGHVLETSALKKQIQLRVINDGLLVLNFRAADRKFAGQRFPLWCDYKSIKIDGNEVLTTPVSTWHDKPFRYECKVKDRQILSIEFECQYYDYKPEELKNVILKLKPDSIYLSKHIDKLTKKIYADLQIEKIKVQKNAKKK